MGRLHRFLDFDYGANGDAVLLHLLAGGANPNEVGPNGETPLHVAVRRRRLVATKILLQPDGDWPGADINKPNAYGKSAYAHAARRGFDEVVELLERLGADTQLAEADRFAIAVGSGNLDEARRIADENPSVIKTGNPEEDRLLADIAGRDNSLEAVRLLIELGADVTARGLDDGTPLHIAAWFGQPQNASVLVEAGAPLEIFDAVHESSPLGWAVHGSRYSGAADERSDAYDAIVRMLLSAGAKTSYPNDASDAFFRRLLRDASPSVASILRNHGHTG